MAMKRIDNDFYETPKKLTLSLLKHCPFIEGKVVEPCAGNSKISNCLIEEGYEVKATDIIQGVSYDATKLDYWKLIADNPDWTITNPPFNQASEILKYALDFSQLGVAMLLRLTFLEPCKSRAELLKFYADNLVAIIPVNPRPKFRKDTKGSDSATVAWFVWRKDWSWKKLDINCPFIFENQWNI